MNSEKIQNNFIPLLIGQIKLQCAFLFSGFRFSLQLLMLGLLLFVFNLLKFWQILDNQSQVFKGIQFVLLLLSIYSFLIVVIPAAKVKNRKLTIWVGLLVNLCFWSVVSFVVSYYLMSHISSVSISYWLLVKFLIVGMWVYFSAYYFIDIYFQQKTFNQYRFKIEKKIEAENKFLKTQINPHFLFNTLNNVYSQSLHSASESATTIVKLKDLLHYMLYDCEQDFVPLEKELIFIESYVHLESIRNTNQKVKIDFQISGLVTDQKIAPLIIVNFVENAFKHGLKSNDSGAFINIEFTIDYKRLIMNVKNSKSILTEKHEEIVRDNGIGLENVQKRLALLYPNRHQLHFMSEVNSFAVNLQISLY